MNLFIRYSSGFTDEIPDSTRASDDYKKYSDLLAKDTLKCNTNVLVPIAVSLKSHKLTDEQLFICLQTFDHLCNTNSEYSEFSNELLFLIIQQYPSEFLTVLESKRKLLEIDYIIEQLSSPVNDLIDIQKTFKSIQNAEIDSDLRQRVLNSLKIAIENTHN